jgi:hypothetical protein
MTPFHDGHTAQPVEVAPVEPVAAVEPVAPVAPEVEAPKETVPAVETAPVAEEVSEVVPFPTRLFTPEYTLRGRTAAPITPSAALQS